MIYDKQAYQLSISKCQTHCILDLNMTHDSPDKISRKLKTIYRFGTNSFKTRELPFDFLYRQLSQVLQAQISFFLKQWT